MWIRGLALQLDILAWACAMLIGVAALGALYTWASGRLLPPAASWAMAALSWLAYFGWSEASAWRATPAKRLLGMRTIDERGARAGLLACLLRAAIKLVCIAPCGLPLLAAAFTQGARAPHDLACGTRVVVRDRPLASLPGLRALSPASAERLVCAGVGLLMLVVMHAMLREPVDRIRDARRIAHAMAAVRPLQLEVERAALAGAEAPAVSGQTLAALGDRSGATLTYSRRARGAIRLSFESKVFGRRVELDLLPRPRADAATGLDWSCTVSGLPSGSVPKGCLASNAASVASRPGRR